MKNIGIFYPIKICKFSRLTLIDYPHWADEFKCYKKSSISQYIVKLQLLIILPLGIVMVHICMIMTCVYQLVDKLCVIVNLFGCIAW